MSELESVAEQKAHLRRQAREVRAQLGAERIAEASAAICARLAGLVRDHRARTEGLVISAFWPLPGEIDLRPLLRSVASDGVTVALPTVTSTPVESPRLIHRAMPGRMSPRSDAPLVRGRFGVMEPPPGSPEIAPEAVDLAVVPALAVSREGVRLGYGGGYYDTFLAQTSALRIGVVLAACLVDLLPAESHDARMHRIMTEEETLRVDIR
ncbi:MAG: 5-formyltetrahydrofolate cyclo-ligase [Bacteroidota bacterium]